MNINDNLKKINSVITVNRLSNYERLNIIKIAKVSNDINDLLDNLEWEYSWIKIKRI